MSRSRKLSNKNRRNSSKTLKRNTKKSSKRNTRKSLKKNTRKTKRNRRVNMRGGMKRSNSDGDLPDAQRQKVDLGPRLHDILKNKGTLEKYNRTSETYIRDPIEEEGNYFTDDIYEKIGQVSLGKNIDKETTLKSGCYMFVLTTSNNMYIYGPCTSDDDLDIFWQRCCKKEFRSVWDWWEMSWFTYRMVHPLLPGPGEPALTAGIFIVNENTVNENTVNTVVVLNDSGHYLPGPFTKPHARLISNKFLQLRGITQVNFMNINSADYCFTFNK